MQGILFRAVAFVHGRNDPETHVFFEVPPLVEPGEELLRLLDAVWRPGRKTVEAYNLCDETELLRKWAVGSVVTGDARLFEVGMGDGGRVHYCDPGRTQLLVSPGVLRRLARAQADAQALQNAGYTIERSPVIQQLQGVAA